MLVSRLSRWLVLFLVLMVTAAGTRLLSLRRSQAIHKLQHLNALIRTDLRNETEAEAHINLKAEDYYLFVVVWKMPHPLLKGWAHHSENTWCKVRDFTPAQQRYLDGKVRSIEMTGGGYSDLGVAWKSMQADCEMVGYGNGDHTESCLGTGGSRGSCSGTYESWTTINATKRGGHKKLEAKYIYGRSTIAPRATATPSAQASEDASWAYLRKILRVAQLAVVKLAVLRDPLVQCSNTPHSLIGRLNIEIR
eukprot:gnl/TRDRNA2_/TRDRNA2_35208_c0_seq2.p1 gnl/TRDRNA2_/TRDRNA2_35208_c0~~gnl/TRDRNA2_/TRDRNA2_35208_c0_seq2.p1  ORF type:complete len:250 (+),score=28.54 gnl/TRDRNA2_/TRDRNA2_35208_c0_seq2:98-847(+)